MTPKQILSNKFRKGISPENKVWFEKYRTEAEDPSGYYPNVQEFLEFCTKNNKDISNIDKTDVDAYVVSFKKLWR